MTVRHLGDHWLESYYVTIGNVPQAVLLCSACGRIYGEYGLDFLQAWEHHLDKVTVVDRDEVAATGEALLALRRRAVASPRRAASAG